jgi:cytoskeletal protein CcmA (bactofilin family)
MFEKKSTNDESYKTDDSLNVFKPSKSSAKVIIGNGVKMIGEITEADDVQIDGNADVTLNTLNLVVGSTGDVKGTITSTNIDVSGKLKGKITAIETLTVQELGTVSGSIEYKNMQIKLGGKISGKMKVSDKISKLSDYKKNDKKAEEIISLQDVLKDKNT